MTDSETAILDITGETCPMTFVRTRLALDRLPAGGRLRVRLRGAVP
ncbi:sulfurtransferase TusA family protein, partial [Nguyenibacter vanlangensis]